MEFVNTNGSLLKDRIYNYVINNIQNGTFLPNSKLNEEFIANALDVSRTPVREVLTSLATEGSIQKVPHKGFFVRDWSEEEKTETYEVIASLDFLCAKKALNYITEEDFKKMRECIAKMDVAIEFQNYADYVSNQSAFHYTYINRCNNSVLVKTISNFLKNSMPVTYSFNTSDSQVVYDLFKETNEQHRKILEALLQRDLSSLERVITEHWTQYHTEPV